MAATEVMLQSLQDACDAVDQLDALPTDSQLNDASGAVRVYLQGSLCAALLKSLGPQLPPTAPSAEVTPSQQLNPTSTHQSWPTTAPASTAHAWSAAAPALELIYSWEDEEVVLSVIEFWRQASNLLCGSWLQQQQQHQQQQPQQTPPASGSQDTPAHAPSLQQANPSLSTTPFSQQQPCSPTELQSYLTWLWALGPAALASVVQQLHRFYSMTGLSPLHQQGQHQKGAAHQLLSLLLLFLQLHHTSNTTSSSPQPAVQLLQLLHGSAHSPGSVAAAITAGEAFSGVCCLLQAAAVIQPTPPAAPPSPAAEASTASDSLRVQAPPPPEGSAGAAAAAAGAPPAWPQLAEAAGQWLRDSYGWCGFGQAAGASAASAAAAAEAARHAATGFGAGSAAASVRPGTVEGLYDCFMMALLQQMLTGPPSASLSDSPLSQATGQHAAADTATATAAASGQGQAGVGAASQRPPDLSDDAWECWLESAAFRALAALVATYDRPDALARGLHLLTQQRLLAAENAAATAAAAAANGGSQVGAKSSGAAAKKAEKTAMGRALLLLQQRVFLWRQHQQGDVPMAAQDDSSTSRAVAGGVHQLLVGLGELLRPAANCSVEWRCAALAGMLSAVEGFTEEFTGEADLELLLWCDTSVEALIYCSSHDPSIQARRAAVQLLQHVVLPHSSSTARSLVRCLADRLCDKDAGVAAAALQLFVQLEPKALCSCLSAAQWCSAVQAGLQMLCGSPSGGAAGTQAQAARGSSCCRGRGKGQVAGEVDAAARQQFAGLLRKVLLSVDGAGPNAQQGWHGWQWLATQGGRVVGVEGCRHVLLLLMQEPNLEVQWQTLADCL